MNNLSNFALIHENKVKNIIVGIYPDCDAIAKQTYGDDAFAKEIWSMYYPAGVQIPANIGDDYIDDKFYRNGEEVVGLPTVDVQTEANTNAISDHNDAIDDLWVAVLEG